jgi:hypothetical protein
MLQVRMQALERHLEEAEDPSKWKENLDLQNVVVDEELWMIAIEKIHDEATAQHDAIKTLIQQVTEGSCDEEQAWSQYTTIQADSEQIFRECLELLGGLALRDRTNEEHLCKFADEFIKELARAVGRLSRFTIPVLDQSLSSTLRRVATVRFPEWHMWTLPLVAYEYAEALIEENFGKLRDFASELADEAMAGTSQATDDVETERSQTEDEQETIKRRLERKMCMLLADAVATYTSGPAYACSTIVLRLNPLVNGTQGRPRDDERAALILGVLRTMSQDDPPSFKDAAQTLDNYWKESVATADPGVGHTACATTPIDVARVLKKLRRAFFRPKTAYSADDWLLAQQWSSAWVQEIHARRKTLEVPDNAGPERRLRDALNACWHCRLETTRDFTPAEAETAEELVERIADVGRRLSMAIMQPPVGRAGGPASAPQPER